MPTLANFPSAICFLSSTGLDWTSPHLTCSALPLRSYLPIVYPDYLVLCERPHFSSSLFHHDLLLPLVSFSSFPCLGSLFSFLSLVIVGLLFSRPFSAPHWTKVKDEMRRRPDWIGLECIGLDRGELEVSKSMSRSRSMEEQERKIIRGPRPAGSVSGSSRTRFVFYATTRYRTMPVDELLLHFRRSGFPCSSFVLYFSLLPSPPLSFSTPFPLPFPTFSVGGASTLVRGYLAHAWRIRHISSLRWHP